MIEPWHDVEGFVARLQLERFSAIVDSRNPAGGLRDVHVDGRELAAFHPLGVALKAVERAEAQSSVERYLRGGDLVATYADQPAAAMRTQIYWRAAAHERHRAIAAISLVVSVQTSLLDSHPALAARSQLVASEAYRLTDAERGTFASILPAVHDEVAADDVDDAPQCYLFRLPGRQYSYAEMVQPSDERHSHWEGWLHGTDYRLQLQHELFPRWLEKGVILRARVLGVLLDRQDDKACAAAHWAAFLRDELPLTT
jgi:hypothetical protein